MNQNDFKFFMPASLEKSKDGEWKVRGLASTESVDQQGEILIQKGMDLTPIDQKRGFLNYEHRNDPANLIGTLDGYSKTSKGLYIEGRLFKNHELAKHVHDIMSSLDKSDVGRCGLSVEGKILERDSKNPKIIKKCQIKNVALTFNPVNSDTFVNLAKAMQDSKDLMKSMEAAEVDIDTNKTFSSEEVVELLQKALGINSGAADAPNLKTDGNALQPSNMSEEDKKKKKEPVKTMNNDSLSVTKSLKKLDMDLYKSNIIDILDKLQKLYPNNSRSEIWACFQERLERKFPELKD